MAKTNPAPKDAAKLALGAGGETHQTASAPDARITTNFGVPVSDDQNSLKAGPRGPALLEDFVLREKIQHFDHERIPERIVHARGSAAHGYFELTKSLAGYTRAKVLTEVGKRTEVFARFSTVAGGAGSVDTPARRPRLCGEALYGRRQLGPGRQQHPGLLHPGRDQVPGPDPRGEDGGGSRLSAGRQRS